MFDVCGCNVRCDNYHCTEVACNQSRSLQTQITGLVSRLCALPDWNESYLEIPENFWADFCTWPHTWILTIILLFYPFTKLGVIVQRQSRHLHTTKTKHDNKRILGIKLGYVGNSYNFNGLSQQMWGHHFVTHTRDTKVFYPIVWLYNADYSMFIIVLIQYGIEIFAVIKVSITWPNRLVAGSADFMSTNWSKPVSIQLSHSNLFTCDLRHLYKNCKCVSMRNLTGCSGVSNYSNWILWNI